MLSKAIKLAINHNVHNLPRMAAIVTYKKQIIGIGYNSLKTHPKQYHFSKRETKQHIHAEMAAIINALSNSNNNLEGASIYVARVLKNNQPALAKPCPVCQKAIEFYGIKRVFYTED